MAKKDLKNALRAHEVRKAHASRAHAAEEAAKRKALSVRGSKQQSKRAKSESGVAVSKAATRPFKPEDTILLVGEGNFSFAHSLLVAPHNHSPTLLLATALDNEEECYRKYPDAKEHVSAIRSIAQRDSIVIFGVDAGSLDSFSMVTGHSSGSRVNNHSRWSKVVFNFPHLGAGHKDEARNVLSNQLMLLRFLVSVAPFLTTGQPPSYAANVKTPRESSPDSETEDTEAVAEAIELSSSKAIFRVPPYAGSVLITLRNCKPYTLWNVPMLAKKLPSMYNAIASSAPPLEKGVKGPTKAQIDRLMNVGQGKAYRVWRSFQFKPEQYPLYAHRRTVGWKQGRSTSDNEDIMRSTQEGGENRTWELGLTG